MREKALALARLFGALQGRLSGLREDIQANLAAGPGVPAVSCVQSWAVDIQESRDLLDSIAVAFAAFADDAGAFRPGEATADGRSAGSWAGAVLMYAQACRVDVSRRASADGLYDCLQAVGVPAGVRGAVVALVHDISDAVNLTSAGGGS